jgi:sugar O-acyltransferase (sialic acid O-acetyltransferase NeuD family)
MNLPVIVLGGGGHAKVLIDTLLLHKVTVVGVTVPNPEQFIKPILGIGCIGTDEAVTEFPADSVRLVNGLGSIGTPIQRKQLFLKFKALGFQFSNVIHPSAVIASDVTFSEGVQIMAGVVVQVGCYIGSNTIVNTKASIDHDCVIGDHVHIAPGVTLSGGVQVGEGAHIGTGATVIQGVRIGKNSVVGAGALVLKDVPDGVTVIGVPAREVQT